MFEKIGWIKIIIIFTIITFTFIGYKLVDITFKRFVKKEHLHNKYFKNISKAIIIIYAVGLIANQFDSTAKALSVILASSGLLVAVLGFAAQESLSNIINGLFISIFKPFEIGDRVTLVSNKITGIIEDLTLRHTVIKTFTNTRLIIPNSTMNKEIIENAHYGDSRAAMWIDVWVSYDSDIRLAMKLISEIISSHELFIDTRTNKDDPLVQVLLRELGQSGICLRATVWTSTVSENFLACSDIRLNIKETFDKNNIKIPYPHVEIV